jgi:hypothetical protein
MKQRILQRVFLALLLVFSFGCASMQEGVVEPTITSELSGTKDLILTNQDLAELGMAGDNFAQLSELGITSNGSDCKTEEYQTDGSSTLAQYSICSYVIESLNNTEVIIELKKFADPHALNGSYQYESLHYRSSEGLLSENEYGDQSRFYVNSESDYGGEFNDPSIYYYTLYATKNDYLIHVTSKGTMEEAKDSIAQIGHQILSKFE